MRIFKKTSTNVLALGMVFSAALVISHTANAKQIWSNFSLSYLKGSQYKVIEENQQFFTIEHASGHDWGSTFFFTDRNQSESGATGTYGEFAPRVSLGYLTGSDLSFGIVKDVLIASNWERGDGFDNYMIGLGVNLELPGFNYFSANIYQVNNQLWDNDQMITLTFGYPFKLGNAEFLYDGFLDWSKANDTNASELNFTTQLKYNIGGVFKTKAPVYIGLEYAFWNNKFGISDVDERASSLLLKWHF